MKLRHVLPFAILLAWQVAPQRADTIRPTRFSLSLGYGLAQLEDYTPPSFDCNGKEVSPAQSERVQVTSLGARAEMVAGSGMRLTAFGGNASSGRTDVAGAFFGFQIAWEGQNLGIGGGLTAGVPSALSSLYGSVLLVPTGGSTGAAPNVYVRLGPAEHTNFRFEFLPPSETSCMVNWVRAGIAWGRTDGFVGLGATPYGSLTAFADLAIPVSGGPDVLLRGQFGPGHLNPPWGLALGVRFNFPR